MASFAALAEQARRHPAVKDVGFIRVDCTPVAKENERQARWLVKEYGRVLTDIALQRMHDMRDHWEQLMNTLDSSPQSLGELKVVLGTVREIKLMRMDTELAIADVVERFRTLSKYEEMIHVDAEEAGIAAGLLEEWTDVVNWALTKDARLAALKQRFATTTQAEAEAFAIEAAAYLERYQAEGPAAEDGVSLDEGLEMLPRSRE